MDTMLTILICDDDTVFAGKLKRQTESFFQREKLSARVFSFSAMEEIGGEILSSCDIALLDIDFAKKPYNGLDIAHRLREVRKDAVLIFITNYIEYAPEGYEVSAFRYLLKEKVETKLEPCLTEALAHLRQGSSVFKLMVDGEVVEIRLDDLLYVESMGHTLYYHLPDRQYSVYSSLSRAEEELSQRGFLRIHKSYLVNMGHLRRFSVKEALLDNGQVLPVSEKNYAALKRQFLLWKGMS